VARSYPGTSLSRLVRKVRRDPLILPFYLPSLILAFFKGMLVPVVPLYARDFSASYGLVGLVLAGEALGTLLSDVPAGVLLRRVGSKRTMLGGLCCTALSTVALFWARSVPEVLVYRLLAGLGLALYSVSRHAYVAQATVVTNRGRAIALFGGIVRIGGFAGPAVGGVVAAALGLRAPFVLVGAGCLAALAIAAIAVRPDPPASTSGASEPASQDTTLLSALRARYRVLVAAGSAQILAQTIRTGLRIVIPLYAADVLGLDVRAIGYILSLSSAADMSLFYPTGLIMDRLGRKVAIVPSFLIQAAGMSLVPLTGSFGSLLAAAVLIGFGNGLGSGTMMTLGADLSPRKARGEFLGVWRLIGDVGFTGGPLVVGEVADLLTLQAATWVMAGTGLLAAAIFLFLVPETLKKYQRLEPG